MDSFERNEKVRLLEAGLENSPVHIRDDFLRLVMDPNSTYLGWSLVEDGAYPVTEVRIAEPNKGYVETYAISERQGVEMLSREDLDAVASVFSENRGDGDMGEDFDEYLRQDAIVFGLTMQPYINDYKTKLDLVDRLGTVVDLAVEQLENSVFYDDPEVLNTPVAVVTRLSPSLLGKGNKYMVTGLVDTLDAANDLRTEAVGDLSYVLDKVGTQQMINRVQSPEARVFLADTLAGEESKTTKAGTQHVDPNFERVMGYSSQEKRDGFGYN